MQILEKSGILFLALERACQDVSKLLALHLAGLRARQLGHGADPSRAFVPRQSQLAGPGGGPQRLCGIAARGHEQCQAIETVRIGHQDAGGLADRRLERRSRLELSRLHPLPGNLDQLVGAALVYEKAVGVLHEHVPRAEPSIAKLLLRLVGQIGVAARLRRMLHPEHALPIQADLDSGERPAGARAVRGSGRRDHAGTECLGHAVEVEQFAANRLLPVLDERLSSQLVEHWKQAVGGELLNLYGMSETFCACMITPPGTSDGTRTGRPLAGVEVRLDRQGVLWVKHPAQASGYTNLSDQTQEQFRDGWFCSRDVFVQDADGFFVHQGRSDELVKIAGQWVQPGELEAAAALEPAVGEAACVLVPDADGLDRLALFVTARGDAAEALRAAARACELRLPRHKRPSWVRAVAELPRTATGKVQRYKLPEILQRELARKE